MKKLAIIGGLAAILPSFAFAAYVAGGETATVPVSQTAQNMYLVGGTVSASNPVSGDLMVAGGTVVSSGNIEKDAFMVGGNISAVGGSVEDLRIVGGNITVGKKVMGEAMIAGGQITLTADTQIENDSYIAGGTVVFSGTEKGNLTLVGGNIRIDGTVLGNLKIKGAEKVTFGSQAIVKGMVEYSAPNEATIETGAQLTNAPVFKKVENVRKGTKSAPAGLLAFLGITFFLKLIATLAAAYLLWNFCKKGMVAGIEETHGNFWKILLRGFGIMVLTPIAAIILMFTVVGWIPAVIMLLAYVILLILATPTASIIAASIVLRLFKKNHTNLTWYHILLGFAVLKLIALIPVIGWLACFIVYLSALGSLGGVMKSKLSA